MFDPCVWLLFFNCRPTVLPTTSVIMCLYLTVSWVDLKCVIVVFPCPTHLFLVFHIYVYYNLNRSTGLCNLLSDNSHLALSPVNYFTIIIAIADRF